MFLHRISSPPRRLQIFVSDLSATGVVRNAVAIANAAAAAGYQVRLLSCHPEGPLRNEVSARVTLVGLLKSQDSGRQRRSELKQAFLAYRKHCLDWQPDVMLSSGNHAHLLSTFAWAGLPGAKVLRISNDLSHGTPSWATRLWRNLKFRLVTARASSLVLNSQALGEHPLLASYVTSGKAVIIPNGVDAQSVAKASRHPCPHRWSDEKSVPVVLAVARPVKQKNLRVLISAFARARRQKAMRLIVLGHSSEAQIRSLRSHAERLAIGDEVDFVAATENPFPYVAAASALALPSLWEGSSNVLLEAMACGTPVIASRTAGDARHVLGEGRHGILIDPHDVDGLAAALLHQTSDQKLTPGARAQDFDRGAMLEEYLRLFESLISQQAHQPSYS